MDLSRTGGADHSVWGLLFIALTVSLAGPFLAVKRGDPKDLRPIAFNQSEGRFIWREPGQAVDGAVETNGESAGTPVTGAKGLLFGRKLDLALATAEDLDSLPGVGPVTARAIINKREETGGYASVEELRKVDGLGPKKVEFLKNWVSIGRDP